MIEGRRCNSCGHRYVSTVEGCSLCGGKDLEHISFTGKGVIYAYTTVYVPSGAYKDQAPFTIGLVDLAEGPRVTVRLKLPDGEQNVGQEVSCIEQNPAYMVFS